MVFYEICFREICFKKEQHREQEIVFKRGVRDVEAV
jgi:hypothetical protein